MLLHGANPLRFPKTLYVAQYRRLNHIMRKMSMSLGSPEFIL